MRILKGLRAGSVAVLVFSGGLLASIPSGAAQGVFSEFFSWIVKPSQPKRQRPVVLPKPTNPYLLAPQTVQPRMSSRSWKYRTVCVRLCDGYYFPINHSSPRSSFHSDADQCQSRCQGQTQLFYMPSSTSDMKEARDISGKPYSQLENAFLYRKKYLPSCTCRPAPWSAEERARHAMYASPMPKVALNDEVLDRVAAKLEKPAADNALEQGPNPYQNAAAPPRADNPYRVSNVRPVARKRPSGRYMGLGAKSKKVRQTRKRRRQRNWHDSILNGTLN